MTLAQERRAFEKAVAKDPYDAGQRIAFAGWLAERGFKAEARQQRWVARAIEGKRLDGHLLVFSRQGVTARPRFWVSRPAMYYWRSVAGRLFREFPDCQFLVVSPLGLRWHGFRVDPSSPVIFYRAAGRHGRVLIRRVALA